MRRWSALILAAGAGQRFGGGKLLATLAGRTVIRRVAEAVLQGGFAEVLVVTGAEHDVIRLALAGLDIRIIHAPDWAEGMAASLRTGIAALGVEQRGVCVFLGDMPLVPVHLCPALAQAAEQVNYAARPLFEGKPGHPVAFARAAFTNLAQLSGDQGANTLLRQRPEAVAYLETADNGALFDIDTPTDLVAAERAWNACATSATSDSATSRGALPKP